MDDSKPPMLAELFEGELYRWIMHNFDDPEALVHFLGLAAFGISIMVALCLIARRLAAALELQSQTFPRGLAMWAAAMSHNWRRFFVYLKIPVDDPRARRFRAIVKRDLPGPPIIVAEPLVMFEDCLYVLENAEVLDFDSPATEPEWLGVSRSTIVTHQFKGDLPWKALLAVFGFTSLSYGNFLVSSGIRADELNSVSGALLFVLPVVLFVVALALLLSHTKAVFFLVSGQRIEVHVPLPSKKQRASLRNAFASYVARSKPAGQKSDKVLPAPPP